MLDERAIERDARQNEIAAYWMFKKKSSREVVRLDTDSSGRRPDFHIYERGKQGGIICEVKSILSAGYVQVRHMSSYTLDRGSPPGRMGVAINPEPKIMAALDDAVSQYRALVRDLPRFRDMPFAVALFFDFFADEFDLISKDLPQHPLVSALLRVEVSKEQDEFYSQFTSDELLAFIEGRAKAAPPPPTKKWALIRNRSAEHPVAKKWFEPCFEF